MPLYQYQDQQVVGNNLHVMSPNNKPKIPILSIALTKPTWPDKEKDFLPSPHIHISISLHVSDVKNVIGAVLAQSCMLSCSLYTSHDICMHSSVVMIRALPVVFCALSPSREYDAHQTCKTSCMSCCTWVIQEC